MQRRVALATVFFAISVGRNALAGDCVLLSNEQPKPVTVTGAFRGRTTWVDPFSGGRTTVSLFDTGGRHVVSTRTDARGRFSFPRVPNGRYRVGIANRDFFDEIEITNASATCRTRETLYVRPDLLECGGGGGIVRPYQDPSTVRGDGLPRQRSDPNNRQK